MTFKNAASDVLATIGILQRARAACADLESRQCPLSARELAQREQIIDTVIRSRRLLRMLQDSATDQDDALRRFMRQRGAMQA